MCVLDLDLPNRCGEVEVLVVEETDELRVGPSRTRDPVEDETDANGEVDTEDH